MKEETKLTWFYCDYRIDDFCTETALVAGETPPAGWWIWKPPKSEDSVALERLPELMTFHSEEHARAAIDNCMASALEPHEVKEGSPILSMSEVLAR
jgi:hypothetical protein